MSFIPYLNACLNTLKITPEELINQDIIRTEKILKVESKINSKLDINYLNTFLDAIKNNKNELLFLINETLIIQILEKQKIRFYNETKLKVINDSFKDFLDKYLKQDLLFFCEKSFKDENYDHLTILSYYQNVMPDEVIEFIEKKTINKLNYIIENLKKGYFGSTSLNKSNFIEFTSKIDTSEIIEKKKEITLLLSEEISKTASTPGLIMFFRTISRGIHYSSITPNSVEEREEKKYALKEMYFIFKILGGIVAFMIFGIFIANDHNNERKAKIEKENNLKFSKTILGHLSNYTTNDIVNFTPIDTFSNGYNVLQLNENRNNSFNSSLKKTTVTNNSNFDAILVSYDLTHDNYTTSYYIKKKDSVTIDSPFFYLCLGNNLGILKVKNENGNYRKSKPRFKNLYKHNSTSIDNLIDNHLYSENNFTLTSENDLVYIESKKPFYVSTGGGLKSKIALK